MTAIDRTIYRRMKRSYTTKELIEAYTPTAEERRFVCTMTRTAQNQLNLMLWIKLFPCLGYFPALSEIPPALVDHVRQALDLAADIVPGYDHDRTLYRHHQVVREYYQILPYGKEARRVILRTLLRAVRTMDNPADMINAALEELIKQRYEMPAFSTLDRLTGRVRTLVYGRICRMVQRRMNADFQNSLEALFEVQLPSHRSAFSQLKLVPPSPTLSHLKVWQDRLAWLMELGTMEPLLKDIPPAIVKHFAAEARALDTSELQEYTPAKRLTLLTCLIRQTQMSTQDDLIDMFLKRMSTIQVRAKEALQLARDAQQKTTAQLVETLTYVVETAVEDKEQDDATVGKHVREILEKRGGQEQLLEQCQQVAASLTDEYQPLMWSFYKSHRRALFQLVRSLPIHSTTQDHVLITALNFILTQENRRSLFVADTLDLSFASEVWQRLIRVKRKKRTKLARRPLEVCGSQASAGLYIRFWDDDLHLTGLNLADSQWHYVVVTVSNSGNTVNVFVDNKQPAGYVWNGSCYTPNAQAQPFSMPFPVNTTATPIGIGNSDWGSGFNGDMDEVAIYPTALTATQVAAHYTAGNAQGSFGVGSPRVLESRVGQSVIPAAIAAFTDSTASPSSSFTYTATVDWGDGATSGPSSTYVASQANDCVVLGSDIPGACFDIIANHAYVNTGVYTYKIVVTRSDGQTLDINGEAEVSPTNSDALTSYKYQARTGVLTWLKPDGSWFGCTATVIHSMSHDMLVTAAHCGIPQGNVTQLYFAPGFNTSGGICPFPVPSTNTENGVPILTKCPAADVPFGVWVGGKVLSNPAYNGDSTYGRSNDQSFVRLGGTHCPGNNTSLCDQKSVEDVVGADWMDFFYWQLNNSTPAPIRATTFGYPIDLGEPGVALSPPQSNWSESDVQNFAETLQLCANRKPVTALQIGNPPAPYFALENCSYNTGGLAAGVSGSPYLSNDGPLANAVAAVQQGLAPEYNRLDAYSGVPSLITALTYLQADTNP